MQHEHANRRRYRFFLNLLALVAFAGIGGMQMLGVDGGPVTNYGADLLAPPILYFATREGYGSRRKGKVWRMGPLGSLLLVFGLCALWEFCQLFDFSGTPLAVTRGTFDPLDLLAYAAGLVAAYYVDVRWLAPRGITPAATARIAAA
jgi:hypothetical protein